MFANLLVCSFPFLFSFSTCSVVLHSGKFWCEQPLNHLLWLLLYFPQLDRILCKQQVHFDKELLEQHLGFLQLDDQH